MSRPLGWLKPILLLWATAAACPGQFSSAIQGTILDPSGSLICDAHIKLRNAATGISWNARSNSAGTYRFGSLAPGPYDLTVRAESFKTVSVRVELRTEQTAGLNVTMRLVEVTERIDIGVQPPILDAADSRTQLTLAAAELRNLPVQGRNPLALAAVAPGVAGLGPVIAGGGAPGGIPDNFFTQVTLDISANGRSANANEFTLDGMNVTSNISTGALNLAPNPDAIQEISIQANTFSVENGRASSIHMAVTTRSGGNAFHGTGSYSFTNQDLWSRTVFTTGYEPFRRHDLSAAVGGPVLRSRSFFFASVQPLRSEISSAPVVTNFESAEFVRWAQERLPGTLGTAFLTDHPVANAKTMRVLRRARDVLGTACGTAAAYGIDCAMPMVVEGRYRSNTFRNGLHYSARGDHYFNGYRDRVFANAMGMGLDFEVLPYRKGFEQTDRNSSKSVQGNWTRTFSASTVNEFSAGWYRIYGSRGKDPRLPMYLPNIKVSNMSGTFSSGLGPMSWLQNNANFREVLSHARGRHSFRFGVEAWWGDDDASDFAAMYNRPTFVFTNLVELAAGDPYEESGVAYNPATGTAGRGGYRHRMNSTGAFVQDEWRIRPNLAVTLGLRWDDYGNIRADRKATASFSNILLGAGASADERFRGASVRDVGGVFQHRLNRNLSPRAGGSWSPRGSGRWVVRGGFGIYHDWIALGEANLIINNPPGLMYPYFSRTGSIPPVFSFGTRAAYPFGFTLPRIPAQQFDEHGGIAGTQASVGGIDPAIKPPNVYIASAGVERVLPAGFVAGAMYNHSYAENLLVSTDFNRYAGARLNPTGEVRRLNSSFGSMYYLFDGNEIRHKAMILTLRRPWASGGSFQASYMVSKDADFGQVGGRADSDRLRTPAGFPDQHGLRGQQAAADWDRRHRFALSGVYKIPAPRPAPLRRLLAGWELSSVLIIESGVPIEIYNGSSFLPVRDEGGKVTGLQTLSGDYNADGYNYDYPNAPSKDITGSHSRQEYLSGVFSLADFGIPNPGTAGNLKRHTARNPGLANLDASLLKNSALRWLGEAGTLQFRIDAFNALNRVNLGWVDGSITSPTFGRPTSTRGARVIQLGVRASF